MIDHPRRHFFDDEKRYAAGHVNYDILHEGIRLKRNTLVTGSVTPIYTYWKPALERIRDYHPGIKLIVLFRNPVDRAFSQWNMNRDREREKMKFLDAIEEEISQRGHPEAPQPRRTSYLDRGFYTDQIERLFRFFPREQLKIIKFENLRENTPAVVNDVFTFLGVPPLPKIQNKEQNKIPYPRRMSPEERRYICGQFAADIERVEELLGWDCSDWKAV